MSRRFRLLETAALEWREGLPYSSLFEDIYHSAAGALDQSRHVFIEGNDLLNRWSLLPEAAHFNIGETGFGCGLNFLHTWHLWAKHAPASAFLHYISCEKHPLTAEDLSQSLERWPELRKEGQALLKAYPILTPGYHQLSFAQGKIRLTLMLGDALELFEQLLICADSVLESTLRSNFMDAWYLDGFSPKKNADLWSEPLLRVLALLSKKGSTLATYTVAGSVKTQLGKLGFEVKKRAGFGPKRHMLSAVFKELTPCFLRSKQTPWHRAKPAPIHDKAALIIGAGLAGCATAYSLAKRGWKVQLVDELDEAGQGASANRQAVLFPKLSAYQSPFTQFMLSAFIYASRFYTEELAGFQEANLRGALLLAYDEQEKKKQEELKAWLEHYPQLGSLVSAASASELAGLTLEHPGLFLPLSGTINTPALCQFLLQSEQIDLIRRHKAASLHFDEDLWWIGNQSAPVLILANGFQASTFRETKHLPLKAIRGQMSAVETNPKSSFLKIPLCAEGHVLPAQQGLHYFGASYELGMASTQSKLEDDESNLNKLSQIGPREYWSKEIKAQWTGVRASTPDYLPLVGQVADATQFKATFEHFKTNAKRWIATAGPYYPGLYICAGFGSRGLTTIPLAAEWLASVINQEFSCLPRSLIQALSPARFLYRDLIRNI